MLFPICPSCGTQLSNKQIIYEKELDKICNRSSDGGINVDKEKLLDDLKLDRYCCRQRIMTYSDLIYIVK